VPRFDAASAECTVLSFKEGLLSAVAHDLELRITRFEIDVDDETLAVRARFDTASIRVVSAMVDGAPRQGTLSDADKRKIEQSLADEVLRAREHPEARFTSTRVMPEGDGYHLAGELSLRGRARALDVHARPIGERLVAEVRLHQPDFGIKPFSAMLGAIKIKPDVIVRCAVPWPPTLAR
jgi:polyisoprenoid-binding protein YceI